MVGPLGRTNDKPVGLSIKTNRHLLQPQPRENGLRGDMDICCPQGSDEGVQDKESSFFTLLFLERS